jgi:O-methyltransferase
MIKFLNKFLRKLGVEIKKTDTKRIVFYNDYDHKIGYEFEEDSNSAIKIVRKNTMLPYINLVTLYEQVLFCEKSRIDGDFVECGVWKGGAVGLMALGNLRSGYARRHLHLFDAFEEICAPDIELDGEEVIKEVERILGRKAPSKGELVPLKGIYDKFGGPGDITSCQDLIEKTIKYPSGFVNYHKGWFQNTVPVMANRIEKIAILRLDGDWYESTKICLDYLYDKVVPGGFIIFDDYGLYSGCKKAIDDFFKLRAENYYMNYSSWSCRYIQKKS